MIGRRHLRSRLDVDVDRRVMSGQERACFVVRVECEGGGETGEG